MREHVIEGGGGVTLQVSDEGPEDAPALLFVHGWAQHRVCWQAQTPLAGRFRVVTFDLRGHGASGKPAEDEAYTDAALWGADIHAIIEGLKLRAPLLIGWSYGARVISSYIAHHGDATISGIVLVGGIIAIGDSREAWMMGEDSPALNRDLYTSDQTRLMQATAGFVESCTYQPLPRPVYGTMVAANMLVPPHVRRALFKGDWDCRPVWQDFTKPALVLHGAEDRIVLPVVGAAAAEALPHARHSVWNETGHAPFAEDPARFNDEIAAFAETAQGVAG